MPWRRLFGPKQIFSNFSKIFKNGHFEGVNSVMGTDFFRSYFSGATKGEIPEGSFGTTDIFEFFPAEIFEKNEKLTIWGFLAPEKASSDDLGPGEKIVQKYALAATFWAKTTFSMFGHF